MADEHAEIVIIKRHGEHEEGHHGGAWKIAFADFMTAMMALFLVLWLISATNPKMRIVIARYFNPVKLADQSAEKKGLNDPAGGGPSHTSPAGETTEKHFELPPLQETRSLFDRGGMPTHDDVALFKDPYAVLSEISGQPSSGDAPKKQPAANRMSPEAPPVTDDNEDTFRDPFTTVPVAQPASKKDASAADRKAADAAEAASSAQMDQASKDNASSGKGEGKNDGKEGKAEQANAVAAPAPQALPPSPAPPAPSAAAAAKEAAPSPSAGTSLSKESPAKETAKNAALAKAQAAEAARAGEAEAATLRKEIAGLFGKPGTASPDMPNVEVKMTDEGVLISLTDEANYAMFSIGSAEPKSKTIEAMEKMAQLLKNRPGAIVVRGHTDGRPYKSGSYDNWQLSAARAQMAHYMLVRGGLDEKRIDRIEGYADHKLKVPADAMAAENRRIEILLRKDKQ